MWENSSDLPGTQKQIRIICIFHHGVGRKLRMQVGCTHYVLVCADVSVRARVCVCSRVYVNVCLNVCTRVVYRAYMLQGLKSRVDFV